MDGAGRELAVTEAKALASRAPSGANAPQLTELSGWGANIRSSCVLREAESERQVAAQVDRAGTIARGLGRSYGDAALNAGGRVLGMVRFDRYLSFDERTGTLTCEAGVSLDAIIRDFAPRGWFPMITPGTKFVTVGGCVVNDIHGKAHHVHGTFSNCVESLTLYLASGETAVASRTENAELFWATFGGMGLLGIVLTVTLRLRRVETTYFRQKSIRVNDLDGMLAALEENDHLFPYSVATLDVFASGKSLGRGVLVVGDHATLAELPPEVDKPLLVAGPPKITVPFELPQITLNPLTIRLVNSVIQQIQAHGRPVSHYEPFFYPLDKIAHWNRGYGKAGFTQYQFVIPFADGARRMRQILQTILAAGELPFLNVLKRMGKEGAGILSFPKEGYTYAIDFPMRKSTVSLLRKLDALVLDAGGRVYLGKDSYLDAPTFRAMYPQIDSWLAIKAKYDPDGVFTSDLGRRVGLAR
ncbi:MAG: FAD-binding oxidoreductase [Polyangiaceae bacterium]